MCKIVHYSEEDDILKTIPESVQNAAGNYPYMDCICSSISFETILTLLIFLKGGDFSVVHL